MQDTALYDFLDVWQAEIETKRHEYALAHQLTKLEITKTQAKDAVGAHQVVCAHNDIKLQEDEVAEQEQRYDHARSNFNELAADFGQQVALEASKEEQIKADEAFALNLLAWESDTPPLVPAAEQKSPEQKSAPCGLELLAASTPEAFDLFSEVLPPPSATRRARSRARERRAARRQHLQRLQSVRKEIPSHEERGERE